MADLVVIVPSRGRPESARTLVRVFQDTCTANTQLVFSIDDDDDTRAEYESIGATTVSAPNRTMVEALNGAATIYAEGPFGLRAPFAVGFMGDDHCPRTYGWDQHYLDALREFGTGIVYGHDQIQGRNLPTQCAMTADIVRTLGYMAPPELVHLAVDNFWLELGRGADCIRFLPDVIVEHRHPVAGKAAWDEGYIRVNAPEMYERDLATFARYRAEELPAAVEKVRNLRVAS